MVKNLSYRTIINKDGKYYHGFVPVLPGCHTQGDTIEETRQNLKEAIMAWIESKIENNMSVPKDESLETIETVEFNFRPERHIAYA